VSAASRRLAFGLATLLGRPRGFFIPYRYAAGVAPLECYPAVETLFDRSRPVFARWLDRLEGHAVALGGIAAADAPPAPRWQQDWFPRLDAAMTYAMIRETGPARVLEVGSGHSTRFVARAVADGGLATQVTAIDPAPRADLAGLPVTLLRRTLQEAGLAPFEAIAAGDVVMIDSSHVLMPGSDVDWLINRILPALPAGVRVHIHDIFLPDGYPAGWAWRGYAEQQAVAAMLGGGGWQPLFAARYAATRMADAVAATVVGRLPLLPGAWESGLWLEKTVPAA